MSKHSENKELTASEQQADSLQNKPSEVPTSDNSNTIEVSDSDKLDNKLTINDPDLFSIIEAWSKLPKEIRTAILTIVRAAVNKNES
ncbi:MAG: hypothetical protein P8016_07060 [Sedimentisphaerales bacterium]